MYYVYLLVNERGDRYIGYTEDLKKRVQEHKEGKSRYTSQREPSWKLVYYEAYPTKRLALKRESTLKKNGSMRKRLYERLELL